MPTPNESVAYFGPEGTFTHAAALKYFGEDHGNWLPCPTIPEVFEAVAEKRAAFGVVPIENSIEGSVTFTLDQLLDSGLKVCAEVALPIEQCLITAARELGAIREVLSHPQPLAQCRGWLRRHLPGVTLVPWASTSAAVQAVKSRTGAAAIGSAFSAGREQLPILERGIQDSHDNMTRFFVLGDTVAPSTGHDKTSLAFATKHERGALKRALEIFDNEGINLTRIESRPRPGQQWQYVFFTDLEGHYLDADVQRALTRLEATLEMVRVFGSYPRVT